MLIMFVPGDTRDVGYRHKAVFTRYHAAYHSRIVVCRTCSIVVSV